MKPMTLGEELCMTVGEEDDWLERLFHRKHMRDCAEARRRLAKLKVAELRALHNHYFSKYSGAEEIRKEHLIEELASEIVNDERL